MLWLSAFRNNRRNCTAYVENYRFLMFNMHSELHQIQFEFTEPIASLNHALYLKSGEL
jgi:hypothetical protein